MYRRGALYRGSLRRVDWYGEKLGVAAGILARYGVEDIADLAPAHLRRLVLEYGENHRPGGVHCLYRALRTFLNWWEGEYEPDDWRNPMRKVPPPRVPDEVLDPVDLDAFRAMLAACPARTLAGARDRAMLLFLLDPSYQASAGTSRNVGDAERHRYGVGGQCKGTSGKWGALELGHHLATPEAGERRSSVRSRRT